MASVPHVLGQPDLVQRLLDYLPFDEVTRSKLVARSFQRAARRALTKGRWRPLRFLDERGRDAVSSVYNTGSCDLTQPQIDLLHDAWAIAPGEVLEIIMGWQSATELRDATPCRAGGTTGSSLASVYLRYVAPGSLHEGDIKQLRAANSQTSRLHSWRARDDGITRVCAAFELCDYRLTDLSLRVKMVPLLVEWAVAACSELFVNTPTWHPTATAKYRVLFSPQCLGRALEYWADPSRAARFVKSAFLDGELEIPLASLSELWDDRSKASIFTQTMNIVGDPLTSPGRGAIINSADITYYRVPIPLDPGVTAKYIHHEEDEGDDSEEDSEDDSDDEIELPYEPHYGPWRFGEMFYKYPS